MRELCHIICFVKLGRIDFIDVVVVDFTLLILRSAWFLRLTSAMRSYVSIVALYQQSAVAKLFNNPAFDEGHIGISKPNISLAREVVFSLYPCYSVPCPL